MTRKQFHDLVKCTDNYIGWHNVHELADQLFDSVEATSNKIDITTKEAEELLLYVDDGLEETMKSLNIKSLSTENLINLTQYGVKSGVIGIRRLQEIVDSQKVLYRETK